MNRYNPDIHKRRSIRLHDYDYSQAGMYFITICTHERISMFGKITDGEMRLNDSGQIAQNCWVEIPSHFPNVVLHEYIVMPNHIHGIIEIASTNNAPVGVENFQPLQRNEYQHIIPRSIGSIIRGFKTGTTKQIGYSIWQRNYYEHIIRNNKDYIRIAEYIINNPIRWRKDSFYQEDMNT